MCCDDIGLSLNSKACVPGAVSGNADVQVAFASGSASGVLGLDLPSSRVGLETDLLATTPFVPVPAFFAAFVGWPSFLEVVCPVAAALIAATMVHAALSALPLLCERFGTVAAMLTLGVERTFGSWCCSRWCNACCFRMMSQSCCAR